LRSGQRFAGGFLIALLPTGERQVAKAHAPSIRSNAALRRSRHDFRGQIVFARWLASETFSMNLQFRAGFMPGARQGVRCRLMHWYSTEFGDCRFQRVKLIQQHVALSRQELVEELTLLIVDLNFALQRAARG
jgi:hypothetical protein